MPKVEVELSQGAIDAITATHSITGGGTYDQADLSDVEFVAEVFADYGLNAERARAQEEGGRTAAAKVDESHASKVSARVERANAKVEREQPTPEPEPADGSAHGKPAK